MNSFYCRGNSRLACAVILNVLLVCVLPTEGMSFELLLGTGERGSFSYFAGKAVCRAINKADNDIECRPVPSKDFTDSLTNIQSGSLDLALVNSKMIYDAFHGAGLFRYVSLDYAQLRLLMPMYRTPVSLIVSHKSKITSLDSMEGKSVNSGAPFSLQETVFKEIMKAKGWQESSFRLLQRLPATNSQDFIALHNGSIEALLHVGIHPDNRLELSMMNGRTNIIGLEGHAAKKLLDSRSGFYPQKIPAWTYIGQRKAIETVALETLLITSADTDSDTVSRILAAIAASKKRLKNAHPSFLEHGVNVEILNRSYLHPHPEALLFFQVNQNLF